MHYCWMSLTIPSTVCVDFFQGMILRHDIDSKMIISITMKFWNNIIKKVTQYLAMKCKSPLHYKITCPRLVIKVEKSKLEFHWLSFKIYNKNSTKWFYISKWLSITFSENFLLKENLHFLDEILTIWKRRLIIRYNQK